MLRRRWARPRSRRAGGGCKPPTAVALKRRGGERVGKRQGVTQSGKDCVVERKRYAPDVSKPILRAPRPEVVFDAGTSLRGTC